jgi:CysZ protein
VTKRLPPNPDARGGPVSRRAVGRLHRFAAGMGYLVKGLRMWATSPKLMLLGAIPALIVGAVYATAIVVFVLNLGQIAAWITPFAGGWDDPLRLIARVAAGVALLAAVVFLAVFTFAAVTLAVGDPFYEKIWRAVEERMGGAPAEGGEPFWRSARRGIGNGLRLLALSLLIGLLLFVGGFIPLIGQTVIPVLGATVGGWILALELTGYAFDARHLTLRQRRRMLGTQRASALGFGIVSYLLFLVPFAAVAVMPAAVAGATMLARDALVYGPALSPRSGSANPR